VDRSFRGATLENQTSANSDEVNLDLSASTSSSSLVLVILPPKRR
jgi:hypothetical protein